MTCIPPPLYITIYLTSAIVATEIHFKSSTFGDSENFSVFQHCLALEALNGLFFLQYETG